MTNKYSAIDKEFDLLIRKNLWGYCCKDCKGGGADGDRDCRACSGTGIVNWQIEPLIDQVHQIADREYKRGRIETIARISGEDKNKTIELASKVEEERQSTANQILEMIGFWEDDSKPDEEYKHAWNEGNIDAEKRIKSLIRKKFGI